MFFVGQPARLMPVTGRETHLRVGRLIPCGNFVSAKLHTIDALLSWDKQISRTCVPQPRCMRLGRCKKLHVFFARDINTGPHAFWDMGILLLCLTFARPLSLRPWDGRFACRPASIEIARIVDTAASAASSPSFTLLPSYNSNGTSLQAAA